MFAVGTEKDHVAPWRSVYKIQLFADADVTFVLASGGHNVGIVSPVNGFADAAYQLATCRHEQPYADPDNWAAGTSSRQGSWWPAWQAWLAERSGPRVAPPSLGRPGRDYRSSATRRAITYCSTDWRSLCTSTF